jgi:hypothetical protein
MTSRKAGIFAAAVFAVGSLVSVASATRPCGGRNCAEECLSACGTTRGACCRRVKKNCRRTDCTCVGDGTQANACGSPSAAFLD